MEERLYKKYFIGKSKPGHWSSVYVYKPLNSAIKVKRGEIFAIISLSGPDTFAVSTAGNLILDNLHESYFENSNDSALIALEKAVKGAGVYLQKLLENDSAADVGIDFDLVAMTILGDVVYFVSLGDNAVKVWRDGRITDLAGLLRDPIGDGIYKVASMVAKESDIFFMASNQFDKEVIEDTYIDLAESFSDLPLKQRLYEEESKIALLMVGYDLDLDNLQKSAIQKVSSRQEDEEDKVEEVDEDEKVEKAEEMEDEKIEEEKPKIEDDDKFEESNEEHNGDNDDDYVGDESIELDDAKFLSMKKEQPSQTSKVDAIKSSLTNIFEQIKSKLPSKSEKFVQKETSSDDINNKNTASYLLSVSFSKLKSGFRVFWEEWLGMGKNAKNTRGGAKNKRWGFLLIFIVVIGGMIYFSVQDTLKNQQIKETERIAAEYLKDATEALVKLESDAKVIAKSNLNTERKDIFLNQLNDAEKILDKARNVEKIASDVATQDKRIQYINDLLNKVITISNPEIIVDMGAKNPGSNLSDLAKGENELYYSDQKYGKIYSVNYDGKNEKELATGLDSPSALTYDTNGNVIFLDNSVDRRMGIINIYDKTLQRVAGTSANKLGGISKIQFMVMDAKSKKYRVYALDATNKAVSYMETSDGVGYGLPVKRGINFAELGSAKDISIMDYKIYLLAPFEQGFYRAYGDKDDTPEIAGMSSTDSLLNASAFTVDDLYMYIGDSSTQTIYVISKDNTASPNIMQYKAKFVYKGDENYFKNIKEIVADRTSGKIFVLDGSRIIKLSMDGLSSF
jgi:hypothetical protein